MPGAQGTFLFHVLGHSTVGSLPGGLLQGPSCVFMVVGLLVEGVEWTPEGPRVLFCFRSTGASLTPVLPSRALEGVWPGAWCWGWHVWPGSLLCWVSPSLFTSGISASSCGRGGGLRDCRATGMRSGTFSAKHSARHTVGFGLWTSVLT